MQNGKKRAKGVSAVPQADIFFDTELRELWVNGVLVKRLDCRATTQIPILAVFQEENWRRRIDDPLPRTSGADPNARLRYSIHSLNGCQHPWLIRFYADGSGHGICWELVERDAVPRTG